MKIRTILVAATLTLSSLTTMTGAAYTLKVGEQGKNGGTSTRPSPRPPAPTVALKCRNYGGQQDVMKNPDIINTTGKAIPVGKKLYWSATDGDKGSIVLTKVLAPGELVGVNGTPGQSYSCTAWMFK